VKKRALGPCITEVWGWDEGVQREFHRKEFDPTDMKIIRRAGRDVGTMAVVSGRDGLTVNALYLLPEVQNRGWGTRLLRTLQERGRNEGIPVKLQVLKVNRARRLYERLGFVEVGETETHVRMEWHPGPREESPPLLMETSRLFLREQSLADGDALSEILSDPETMKYYPAPFTREEADGWIRFSIRSYGENGFGLWAVILRASGRYIGQCGLSLQNIHGERVPEIGYHIHKGQQRKGFATEASQACLAYGFDRLSLPEIYIHTSVENTPSRRVAEKLLMEERFEYDKEVPAHGIVMPHVVYSMKREEFVGNLGIGN
jgi:RimJ/RimL family protein N-acetyltransferase